MISTINLNLTQDSLVRVHISKIFYIKIKRKENKVYWVGTKVRSGF